MDNDVASQQEGYAASEINVKGTSRYASLRGYRESFSGHERNHLFLNDPDAKGAPRFVDISGISGLDSPKDARSAVLWDYDRDGWLDVAVINTNAPLLQMWRNTLGDLGQKGNMIAVRFVGSNHEAKPNKARTARDGFGARVVLKLKDKEILREHHCGEGLSAQNSNTVMIGIGAEQSVPSLGVSWPAGGRAELADVPAGSLVTLYEDPSQSPTGEAFVISDYHTVRPGSPSKPAPLDASNSLTLGSDRDPKLGSKLRVYTSMGADCESCVRELPYLASMQAAFTAEQVSFFGLPMDPKDSREALEQFISNYEPPYRLLSDLTPAERAHAEALIKASSAPLGLGNTIITDAQGRVLKIRYGPSSISELRSLMK